jgi:dienelactone hydrolase
VRRGEVTFEPSADEAELPELFRLEAHTFEFQQNLMPTVSRTIELSEVRFPSPVETPHPANNTVHAEYFRPLREGKHPGVVMLHILGGDFDLSRLFCRQLAHHGVAAMFVVLPYYGPRREPGSPVRMVSADPRETVAGMRQAILDVRRAAAWLAARSEIEAGELGVCGISLGGITGALAMAVEPRFSKACLLLAGGDLAQVSWDRPELARVRRAWLAQGRTKDEFFAIAGQIDPVRYGGRINGRKVLMLNAEHDEVIPRTCTESLWRAFGEPEIVWFECGHYSAIRYLFDSLDHATRFFARDGEGRP